MCSYHPLLYWLPMSMCTPASWCLSLHTCTYWALQTEILWTGLNKVEIVPTFPYCENNHVSPNFSTLNFVDRSAPRAYCNKALWMWAFPCFTGVLLTLARRGSWRRLSHTEMQPFVSQKLCEGTPVVLLLYSKWSSSSSQQPYWFHLAALSLLSQTVYITLFNPLLNRL